MSWRTTVPAATLGATSSSGPPTLWTPAAAASTEHETVFSNLAPGTAYDLSVYALDAWGRRASTGLRVLTPPRATAPAARIEGASFVADGSPFVPIALWAVCTGDVDAKLADGVNLFMSSACGSDRDLVEAIAGRAFAVVDARTASAGGAGVLGWNYPDEWDERLPSDVTPSSLAVPAWAGLPSFLTLTNHFYSYAEPLPQGRGMYPLLARTADVLGFDLYPLQVWCRPDAFEHVYESQRELVLLAAGKPTYQWIEAAPMEHCPQPALAPSPQTVRAETWLAIAGGATAIGYFPNGWSEAVEREIARTSRELRELAPALLAPAVPAESSDAAVKVSAHVLNGAVYVVAVNSRRAPVQAAISVPELASREVEAYGEQRALVAVAGTLTDSFEPLQVHLYVAAPELRP